MTPNILLKSLFCGVISLLFALNSTEVVFAAPDKPGEGKYLNFAAGKFYFFDKLAIADYSDVFPVDPWSSGIKLTDEQSQNYNGVQAVAWKTKTVSIVLDLGSVRSVNKFRVHSPARAADGVPLPEKVVVSTKLCEDSEYQTVQKIISFSEAQNSGWGEIILDETKECRYVKFDILSSKSRKIMVDEIEAWGYYQEDPKYVPAFGAYHGAFNNSTSFADNEDPTIVVDPEHKSCPISTFESVVGKRISMFLWYQGMKEGRKFSEIQKVRDFHGGVNFDGKYRMLVYGWLPKLSSKEQASGVLDEYHKQYFKDVASDESKSNGPVWFRPANEMNGSWVEYYGDPVNYVRAWRRMYNIAEQLGATKYNVFVWSPNSKDIPAKDENRMELYYPGDIYVDWLGVSVYPPSKPKGAEDTRYPSSLLNEVEKISDTKPIMVSEGGFSSDYGQSDSFKKSAANYVSDHIRWVREWFQLSETHPRVKAVIWENHINSSCGDRRIHIDKDALELYKELVQDSYWLDCLPSEVVNEMAERIKSI